MIHPGHSFTLGAAMQEKGNSVGMIRVIDAIVPAVAVPGGYEYEIYIFQRITEDDGMDNLEISRRLIEGKKINPKTILPGNGHGI